ncbi:MAG: ferrochelatase [Mycobacteriales bacterium]
MPEPPVDALLLVSFGGPEGADDVLPFLRNVTRDRGVPPGRLAEVAEHYRHFGGVSPINAQNRALRAAIEADLVGAGLNLPVYWGNRNWHPYLADTVREMTADGVRRTLAFVTSAYSSYSSCRQYQEDLAAARSVVGTAAPRIDKLRLYYNTPGFIAAMVRSTTAALAKLPANQRAGAHLAFVAHSIPTSMAASSGPGGDAYPTQLDEASRLVAEEVGGQPWQLAYSSRSGAPTTPWLEPDIGDHLAALADRGVTDVVAVPIGFVSDHMEVIYDLDVEARERANSLGLRFVRAATAGTDPGFVATVRELVLERLSVTGPRRAVGRLGPSHDVCPLDCCPRGSRFDLAGTRR